MPFLRRVPTCVWLCHMSLATVQAKQIVHPTPMYVYVSERFKWGVWELTPQQWAMVAIATAFKQQPKMET